VKFFNPTATFILEIGLFIISIYDINIMAVILEAPGAVVNDQITKDTAPVKNARRVNFLIAISCTLVLYGADQLITGALDLVEAYIAIVQGGTGFWQDPAGLLALVQACIGLVLITGGCIVLWKSTFKTVHFLGNDMQQVFGFTAGGFVMYSLFLGIGGQQLLSYILIAINAYFFIKNVKKNVKKTEKSGMKGFIKAIKEASDQKGDVEDSLWTNWINFYKTAKTRFLGTIFTTTGFLLGVNFRFLQANLFQILYMALIILPFIGATFGMKQSWTKTWRLVAITIPYPVMCVYMLFVPVAVPLLQYLTVILPPDVLSMMAFAYLILVSLLLASSMLNAIGHGKTSNEREETRVRSYSLIVDMIVVVHVTFAFSLVYYFAVQYVPFNITMRVMIDVVFCVIAIVALALFFLISKKSYIKNLYLCADACPACKGAIDRKRGACASCGAGPEPIAGARASNRSEERR
nr:hypothetical protein [Candidatus Sigynarchaeota archaeon]